MGHEITKASEAEQRRIGQDLHDDICQRLAAIKMRMQDFEEKLAESAPMLMEDADDIADRLTDAIHVTRALARGLATVDLDVGGIGMALSSLARSSREILGVECTVSVEDSFASLPQNVAIQLYRIAQECITNAAKHARARSITVTLRRVGEHIMELLVSNDGQPLPAEVATGGGMGLPIMRYRAQSIGGKLNFLTDLPTATTAVTCTLPLPQLQ